MMVPLPQRALMVCDSLVSILGKCDAIANFFRVKLVASL